MAEARTIASARKSDLYNRLIDELGLNDTAALKVLGFEVEPELTPKERGEALVGESGLNFTRGRVYLTGDTIEAAVRVKKTGSPEIVRSSGVGHTKAVLLYREESGDVAAQNLTESA